MNATPAIAAGATLALAAGHAEAASLFDLFRHLCVEQPGNAEVTMQRASVMGWKKASARLERLATAPSHKSEAITDVDSRAANDLNGTLGVYVAKTSRISPRLPRPGQACVVMAGPDVDARSVAAEAAAFANVPPTPGFAYQRSATSYLWREIDGRHVPAIATEGATSTDELKMMVVMARGGVAVLQFLVPANERN